ncbi:MAG: hypothetical protein NTV54_00560 [Ignavibacteriales bacterium]|nr:hypothetical protein [Ignavibacteriales bacterium]
MDNPEQYLLQVLRRTETGLEDSLIPDHVEKCKRLIQKIETAPALVQEIERLKSVHAFLRAALTMEWIMRRVESTGEEFSPDQFEQDIVLLNDKMFESFLSEPLDAPELPRESSDMQPALTASSAAVEDSVSADDYFAPVIDTAFEMELGLTELLDQNMLLGFQRFVETVRTFIDRDPNERRRTLSVIGMIARSSMDVARAQKKNELFEFFDAFASFVKYVEEHDLQRNDDVAAVMVDVGDRLTIAMNESSKGAVHLRHLTTMLKDPSSLAH